MTRELEKENIKKSLSVLASIIWFSIDDTNKRVYLFVHTCFNDTIVVSNRYFPRTISELNDHFEQLCLLPFVSSSLVNIIRTV